MSSDRDQCLIWGFVVSSVDRDCDGTHTVRDSVRADGDYRVSGDAIEAVAALDDGARARLTSRLVEARQQGTTLPVVDRRLVDNVCTTAATSVHERAMHLLQLLAARTTLIGQRVDIMPQDPRSLAWSESIEGEEVSYLLSGAGYLHERTWIKRDLSGPYWSCRVTVNGYSYLEEYRNAPEPSQAFVAMWFDSSMNQAYTEGIRPAIKNTGYEPMRIDDTEHINKIDDEVIREIRRSRFMVADFTSGNTGARGSVYYEAGFAHGLGIPVIPTCRTDQLDKIHFDTRQYAHIPWSDPKELRKRLAARIGAVIGEGPNVTEHQNSSR